MNEAGAADYAPYPGIHHFPRIYVTSKQVLCLRSNGSLV
jgi:hypothetical protein